MNRQDGIAFGYPVASGSMQQQAQPLSSAAPPPAAAAASMAGPSRSTSSNGVMPMYHDDEAAQQHQQQQLQQRDSSIGPTEKAKTVACMACREAKVRCRAPPGEHLGDATCVRCARLDRECVFKEHKRGRKPGKVKNAQIDRRWQTLQKLLDEIASLTSSIHDEAGANLALHLRHTLLTSSVAHASGLEGALASDAEMSSAAPPAASAHTRGSDSSATSPPTASAPSGPGYPMFFPRPAQDARPPGSAARLVELEDQQAHRSVPRAISTLTNPLKLLAHASDAVSPGSEDGAESEGEAGHRDEEMAAAHVLRNLDRDTAAAAGHSRRATENSREADARGDAKAEGNGEQEKVDWTSYFSRGVFHAQYDTGPDLDPIERGVLSAELAQKLVQHFYDHFKTFAHMFDPVLATYDYIRRRSAFLLTVLCQTAAESLPGEAELAERLRRHREELRILVLSSGYKSVEIAQACMVLAAYAPLPPSATDDTTWSLLGTAIRIATETGCNLALYSYAPPPPQITLPAQRERHARQLRNTERLWFSLWLFAANQSSQTGQRFALSDDGNVASCGDWHLRPYALPQDEWIVASIDLRRLVSRATDQFHMHLARHAPGRARGAEAGKANNGAGGAVATTSGTGWELQLDFYKSSLYIDLKRWENQWLSNHDASSASELSPLQRLGALCVEHAKLVALALPLHDSTTGVASLHDALAPHYRDAYGGAVSYLGLLIDRWELLRGFDNSTVTTSVYCSVFALKLASGPKVASLVPDVSAARVEGLVRTVVGLLRGAERDIARRYGQYLEDVLNRWSARLAAGSQASSTPRDRAPRFIATLPRPSESPLHLPHAAHAGGPSSYVPHNGYAIHLAEQAQLHQQQQHQQQQLQQQAQHAQPQISSAPWPTGSMHWPVPSMMNQQPLLPPQVDQGGGVGPWDAHRFALDPFEIERQSSLLDQLGSWPLV